jgi:hypothetical protein
MGIDSADLVKSLDKLLSDSTFASTTRCATSATQLKGPGIQSSHHFNQRRSSDWIVGVRRVRL